MAPSLNGSVRTQFRTIDGLSIRFAESEEQNDDALLLSPWPESVPAFEPTWSRLAEHTHLVAIDLPGFGRSERREALLAGGHSRPPALRTALDDHVARERVGTVVE